MRGEDAFGSSARTGDSVQSKPDGARGTAAAALPSPEPAPAVAIAGRIDERGLVELLDPAASADGPVKVLVPRLPLVLLVVSVAVEPAAMQAASQVLDELVPRLAVRRAVAAGVVRAVRDRDRGAVRDPLGDLFEAVDVPAAGDRSGGQVPWWGACSGAAATGG